MTTIHFMIDFDKKQKLMHDAAQCEVGLSTILRRMVDLYLADPAFRRRILLFVPCEEEF